MANIKNFGIKGVASDVQYGKSGGFVVYDSSNNKFQFKDNGSSLEDVEFATVQAGTWSGTEIAVTKGGTGLTSVAADKIIYTSGANTFAASDISAFGRSIIDDADASAARTTLGLGTIATQASDSVNIDGGAIDGAVIGANSAAAGTFTTINASGTITGDVTGDVTGNADTATTLANARTITIDGDVDATATAFDGSQNITLTTTLDNTGVSAGTVGSSTAIPVITVDAKGRITAASTASISSALTIAADSGSNDTVTVGTDTLTFAGTSNEIETTVTNNQIQIGLPDDVTVGGDLTVSGTLNSDDITSSTVTITGDAVVSGTLTVNGTTTTVNSTTVQVDDPIFEIGDPAISSDDNLDRGIKFNWHDGSNAKKGFFGYDDSASEFVFIADATESSNTFTGTKSAIRTGAINSAAITATSFTGASGATITAFLDEDNMNSNSATAVPTQQSVKAYVDSEISGISSSFTLAADSGSNDTFTTGGTLTFSGTSNEIETTVSNDAITIGLVNAPTVTGTMTAGNFTTAGQITDGAATLSDGSITGGVAATFSGAITGGSLTDGTATMTGGALTGLTGALTTSGTVTGGTLTDGTASINSGAITGATNITASGTVQYGSLSDGSITITAFVDEDNMASDSATLVPTQQSVKAYVDAQLTASDLDFQGDSGGALSIDLDSETLDIAGGTGISTAGSGNTLTVTLDDTAVTAASYGSATAIPVLTVDAQGRITAASTASISTSFTLSDGSNTQTVAGGDTLTIAGTANEIEVTVGATDTATIGLPSTVSGLTGVSAATITGTTVTDGTASLNSGALSGVTTIAATDLTLAGNLTVNGTTVTNSATNTTIEDQLIELGTGNSGSASGDAGIIIERGDDNNVFIGWDESADQVQIATTTATGASSGDLTLTDANLKAGTITYASLSDGAITITAFVDEDNMASDSATLVPTQQSVKAYVDSQVVAQDDGIVRATITANSSASTFTIGAIPSVSGRSYFANKAVLKVTTAFAGGSVDGFKITDNESSETTYVTAAQADPTVTGTYVLDLGMETLTSGTTLQLDVVQSDGSTAAVATSGAVTVTVEYVYNT
tara:strand:+ start:126 stop:3368 length:3243 start_codon:yes stop_codon:yes gene_type:complete